MPRLGKIKQREKSILANDPKDGVTSKICPAMDNEPSTSRSAPEAPEAPEAPKPRSCLKRPRSSDSGSPCKKTVRFALPDTKEERLVKKARCTSPAPMETQDSTMDILKDLVARCVISGRRKKKRSVHPAAMAATVMPPVDMASTAMGATAVATNILATHMPSSDKDPAQDGGGAAGGGLMSAGMATAAFRNRHYWVTFEKPPGTANRKGIQCQICEKWLDNLQEMTEHHNTEHPPPEKKSNSVLKCNHCNEVCKDYDELLFHLREHDFDWFRR